MYHLYRYTEKTDTLKIVEEFLRDGARFDSLNAFVLAVSSKLHDAVEADNEAARKKELRAKKKIFESLKPMLPDLLRPLVLMGGSGVLGLTKSTRDSSKTQKSSKSKKKRGGKRGLDDMILRERDIRQAEAAARRKSGHKPTPDPADMPSRAVEEAEALNKVVVREAHLDRLLSLSQIGVLDLILVRLLDSHSVFSSVSTLVAQLEKKCTGVAHRVGDPLLVTLWSHMEKARLRTREVLKRFDDDNSGSFGAPEVQPRACNVHT